MAKRGKKYIKARKARPTKTLSLGEAIESMKKLSYSSFPGSIELHLEMKLPKDKDAKSLKGALTLPHSTGNKSSVKIAVFTNADREAEAKKAGADHYQFKKLTEDVKGGNIDFDIAIATPDVMAQIAALGKQLGPKGLMPNPKLGTVTDDLASTIDEYKKGKTTFKADDSGNFHIKIGNIEMENAQIEENAYVAIKAASDLIGKKAETVVKGVRLSPTMGPSVEAVLDFEAVG